MTVAVTMNHEQEGSYVSASQETNGRFKSDR